MPHHASVVRATLVCAILLLAATNTGALGDSKTTRESSSPPDSSTPRRLTETEAREQAANLHEMMHSTLRVTHDRYYREDAGLPIPAAILKEVFADVKRTRNITLRWLAVEGQAMNTDHKAQNEFEQQAVRALKSGRRVYEQTQDNVYRRVGAITLSNHCLKCHVPDRRSTRDRTAGLIISIPVK